MTKFFFILLSLGVIGCSGAQKQSAPAPAAPQATAPATESTAAQAAQQAKADQSGVNCKNGDDVRIIQIGKLAEKGCTVVYTKFGQAQDIASSVIDRSHCETVSTRIRGKLEAAGFQCQ